MEVQRINFTSARESVGLGVDPANLSDEEIVKVATKHASKKVSNTIQARALNVLPAVAIASVAILNGASKPGKLSGKLSSVVKTLGAFAIVSGVFDGVKKGFRKIEDNSKHARQTNKEHPVVYGLAKIATSMFLATAAVKGVGLGMSKIAKRFPDFALEMSKMSVNTRKIIDDSKLGEIASDFSKKYAKFKTNHKALADFASKNAFPITVISYFMASLGLSASVEDKRYKIANETATKLLQAKYSK